MPLLYFQVVQNIADNSQFLLELVQGTYKQQKSWMKYRTSLELVSNEQTQPRWLIIGSGHVILY